jgi:hypothetical protein
MSTIKGFKAMSADMACKGFKFEVGKTYETDALAMYSKGFHFCENFFDVYNYYPRESATIVCEIEALGAVQKEDDRSVTNRIKIVKKLNDNELLELWIKRTNSGNRNSGDWNSGYENSGNGNSGNRNSGYGNSGDWNSGDWNSGDWNSGYGNSGNRNSGDWNSGDGNSGYFNTTIPMYLFNKPSDMKYTKEFEARIRSLKVKPILEWVSESAMSEKEKTDFPSHKTTGGFLRKTERYDWRFLTEEDKAFIKSLPNFDDAVFRQISGVSLSDDVEVVVNGQTKMISRAKAKELGLID